MEVTREEMLELAKRETFHLDDRLCPFDRETLRAEAWLQGYEFARRHEPKKEEEAPAAKPLVDEGFCYVITENKGGFYKGDYFEGKARNMLHHVRTAFDFEVNEEIMKDFVKLGLWTPAMGLQMNDVAMQEVNGVVQPVTYNFRGEIDTLDNAEAIEGYVYQVHGVFYAYLKGKWRKEKSEEYWNPFISERKVVGGWDMSEED